MSRRRKRCVMTRTNSPDENDTGTGRYLVLLQEDSAAAGLRTMARTAGLRVASTADVSSVGAYDSLREADGLLLHDLGVAVIRAARDQVDYLARAVEEGGPLAYLEPERLVQARSEEHTSELQSRENLVCRLLLGRKKQREST